MKIEVDPFKISKQDTCENCPFLKFIFSTERLYCSDMSRNGENKWLEEDNEWNTKRPNWCPLNSEEGVIVIIKK